MENTQEVEGICLAKGLILNHWDMGKAQGLRSKDKLVELHSLLVNQKKIVWERTGKSSNCLVVSQRVNDLIFEITLPDQKWNVEIIENLNGDQILMGKSGEEKPIYYSCITIHNLKYEKMGKEIMK